MGGHLLDSSCWIEIFSCGPKSQKCEKYLKSANQVIVPTLVCYEVYKKIRSIISEDKALSVVSFLSQKKVVDLDRETALLAADHSIEHKLAMADSIILAHSYVTKSQLVTMDSDFSKIPGVVLIN